MLAHTGRRDTVHSGLQHLDNASPRRRITSHKARLAMTTINLHRYHDPHLARCRGTARPPLSAARLPDDDEEKHVLLRRDALVHSPLTHSPTHHAPVPFLAIPYHRTPSNPRLRRLPFLARPDGQQPHVGTSNQRLGTACGRGSPRTQQPCGMPDRPPPPLGSPLC
ncbi:hypothetical protein DCS_07283 [Drechmeria coniospora]|uniref:Uncharacterized protein n=1 Tax=Drechmeria coniospora TaxID=98403 RepID=A0A151GDZ8_DRECN|nr:hypothetical protein DCS_07283 [Drechmeria coniospora]KYK55320.1 hypothetical protein DCS_07283 [Drechmeria coniospora]